MTKFKMEKEKIIYLVVGLLVVYMLIHIELSLNTKSAPENILVNVRDINGFPEENADCIGDIISEQIKVDDKKLVKLNSVYEVIDPQIYNVPETKGYYNLETGFNNYKKDYEIRIVCYSPGFSGVSYTIINKTNQNCDIREGGKYLVC